MFSLDINATSVLLFLNSFVVYFLYSRWSALSVTGFENLIRISKLGTKTKKYTISMCDDSAPAANKQSYNI